MYLEMWGSMKVSSAGSIGSWSLQYWSTLGGEYLPGIVLTKEEMSWKNPMEITCNGLICHT